MIAAETHDPAIVIMLTQTHESGKEKCFRYFPSDMNAPTLPVNEHDEFADGFAGTLTLQSITEDEATRSTVREMRLRWRERGTESEGGTEGKTQEKKVWHLLFAGWPDFLIPEGEDKEALVKLTEMSNALNTPGDESPRIVHCSAGVGRSGTFIALDYLLSELEDGAFDELDLGNEGDDEPIAAAPVSGKLAKNDPIMETVDRLRMQRMMMVQGESQFVFLYEVLREKWLERWKRKAKGTESSAIDGGERMASEETGQVDGGQTSDTATRNALEAELRRNAGRGESE